MTGYERPDEQTGSDANWLQGEAELVTGRAGSFRATHSVAFRTEELERFRDQLRQIVESLTGTAALQHIENNVGCTVTLSSGRGSLTAYVQENIGSELRVRDCETDQSYLAQAPHELDAIVRAFPVRGAPF